MHPASLRLPPLKKIVLYIVPTPLGNLQDLSPRAAEILANADLIAAEDTRHTGILLHSLGLRKPMLSLHEHNEKSRLSGLLERIEQGQNIALVSDAGTPLISDPGYHLVQACAERGLPMTSLPGPSAITAALAGSGLPPYPFYFGGFLPVKSGRKATELQEAIARKITNIYFESPHRLVKTLDALATINSECRVCVAREISKKFEEFRRGSPHELAESWRKTPPKGEITMLIYAGKAGKAEEDGDAD